MVLIANSLFFLYSCDDSIQKLSFKKVEIYPENTGTNMGFAFGDINGDGAIDLITHEGAGGGAIRWYESKLKEGIWIEHTIASTGPAGVHFSVGDLEIGDIDNDGDIDILGFEHPGEWSHNYTGKKLPTNLYWFENIDPFGMWQPHYIGEVPDFVKDVELVHLDSNGFLDIVTVTYIDDHNFSIFSQDSINHWTHVQNFSINNLHEGMDSGDIDGDGDIDIATNGYWIENPGNDLGLTWNVHTMDEKWHNQSSDWRQNASKVFCKDINGDDRVEVFISHSEDENYPVSWYEAIIEGDKIHWNEHVITTGFTAVHTLQVGDLDKDGDYDILIGENGDNAVTNSSKRHVRILFNAGDNLNWEEQLFSEEGLYNGLLVDINNDKLLDIGGTSGHEKDPYHVWINQGKIDGTGRDENF